VTAPQGTIARAQHVIAAAVGVDERRRSETVIAMLENNRRRAPGYWIQLVLAMGIATLGLVLDSTAVVIGAMLVSPLMGPIVELGMGFAVGSSFLVIRASLRVAFSVVVVVASAAVMTLALPFHEVTGEIAARAAPTALDLLVAVFCALTAAYTTVRAASDTTTAAAGTAIGIALVPPLCTSGFGIGTGSLTIAGGAALLFTANLSAIVVFAVISFLLLGYNQVDARRIDEDFEEPDVTRTGRLAAGGGRWLHRAFGSRYGLAMRIVIPLVFLGAVFVPLRRALDEVTWEVRARQLIRSVLTEAAPNAVQTVLTVERHAVSLHLLVVGSSEAAAVLETALRTRIAAAIHATPSIAVTAVPDATTLATALAGRRSLDVQSGAPGVDLEEMRRHVGASLAAAWPSSVVGPLLGWELVVPMRAPVRVVTRHIGDSLGRAAEALLARELSARAGLPVRIVDAPLIRADVARARGRDREWLQLAQPILDWAGLTDGASVCVKAPIDTPRRATAAERGTIASVRNAMAGAPDRLAISDSAAWSIRVTDAPCPGTSVSVPREQSR
jgi:uncharacterized hydrophobic protein (TIGR00271 family)